jgi:hypothetical protein
VVPTSRPDGELLQFVISAAVLDMFTKCSVATSPNGWTDNHLCYEWFVKVFIPSAKSQNDSGKKIILIYNGHHSHTAYKLIQKAIEHDIILYCLPTHMTHRLQPLDVGIFGPLSKQLSTDIDKKLNHGKRVTKANFIEVYTNAHKSAFQEDTIISAFKSSGICPLNPNVFTSADFAPSYSTSTQSQLPDGYPTVIRYEDNKFHDGWDPLERPAGVADSDSDSDSSDDEEAIVLGEDEAEVIDEESEISNENIGVHGHGENGLSPSFPSSATSSPTPKRSQPPNPPASPPSAAALESPASSQTPVPTPAQIACNENVGTHRNGLSLSFPSSATLSPTPEHSQPHIPLVFSPSSATTLNTPASDQTPVPVPVQIVWQRWKPPPGTIASQLHAAKGHIHGLEDKLVHIASHALLMAQKNLELKRKLNTK